MGSEKDLTLTHLARIIERDSKDSIYKFALLRGTIDIIQNYPHFLEISGNRARYPMGLLLLRWIEYYYPLLSHEVFVPQKYGDSENRTIAFRKEFKELTRLYPYSSDYYPLEHDLKRGIRDASRIEVVLKLLRKLRNTIVKQPMHYIGSSIGKGGEIYRYIPGARTRNPVNLHLEWIHPISIIYAIVFTRMLWASFFSKHEKTYYANKKINYLFTISNCFGRLSKR